MNGPLPGNALPEALRELLEAQQVNGPEVISTRKEKGLRGDVTTWETRWNTPQSTLLLTFEREHPGAKTYTSVRSTGPRGERHFLASVQSDAQNPGNTLVLVNTLHPIILGATAERDEASRIITFSTGHRVPYLGLGERNLLPINGEWHATSHVDIREVRALAAFILAMPSWLTAYGIHTDGKHAVIHGNIVPVRHLRALLD